jgi:hypothetical protein
VRRHTVTLHIDAHADFDPQGVDWADAIFGLAKLESERATVIAHESEHITVNANGQRVIDFEVRK